MSAIFSWLCCLFRIDVLMQDTLAFHNYRLELGWNLCVNSKTVVYSTSFPCKNHGGCKLFAHETKRRTVGKLKRRGRAFKLFLIWYVGLYTVIYTRIYINEPFFFFFFRTCTVNSYPQHASIPMHRTREYFLCTHTRLPVTGPYSGLCLTKSKSYIDIYGGEFACIQALFTQVTIKLIFWALRSDLAVKALG